MELAREKSPPVIEETVERFTDSDRFEQPIKPMKRQARR